MKHERAWYLAIHLNTLAKRLRLEDPRDADRWMTRPQPPREGDMKAQADPSALASPFWKMDECARYYAIVDPKLIFDADDDGVIQACYEVMPIDVTYGQIVKARCLVAIRREEPAK